MGEPGEDQAVSDAALIHEIKNLVGSIQMNAVALDSYVAAEGRPIVADILAACERMAVRSREYLDRQKAQLVAEIDLSTLVWEVGRSDLDALSRSGTQIELQIGEDCVAVGNAGDLRKVVVILAQNAAQAQARTIWLSVQVEGPHVVIEVRDDGQGIAPADLHRVTDPGYTTKPGGTGHGLAMARTIVRAHRGTLEIESDLGRGTTVRIRLPRG